MRVCFLVNNRATIGRTKALYDAVSQKHETSVILGCGAWDSTEFATTHRIQSLMSADDNEGMFLTAMSYGTQLASHLRVINPDICFVHGDRYEQLVAAQACAYMNIPVWHTEGGDKSGSIDDKVRWAITALSDEHFPISVDSYYALLNLTLPRNTHFVGSVGLDLVRKWEETKEERVIKEPYALVLHHPDTVTHESVYPVISAVLEACGSMRIVWVNANVDAGGKEMMKQVHKYTVDFVKNVPNERYFNLLKYASVRIGNSSSFIKECAYLGKSSVVIGSRQQEREMGENAVWVSNDNDLIREAIYNQMDKECVRDYRFGDGHACERIMEVLDARSE